MGPIQYRLLSVINLNIVDDSPNIVVLIGDAGAFSLKVNITNTGQDAAGLPSNITLVVPYGVNNASAATCDISFIVNNLTSSTCVRNITTTINSGSTLGLIFNFTANMSAYTNYTAQNIGIKSLCANCIQNATTKSINATSFFRNPRPGGYIIGQSNGILVIDNWNQTHHDYQIGAPAYTHNDSTKRLELQNFTFAEVFFFAAGKSLFEDRDGITPYSYNLTFFVTNLTANENVTIELRSPINNSDPQEENQTLVPIKFQADTFTDPITNETFSFNAAFPNPFDFTIFLNGSGLNLSSAQSMGINVTYFSSNQNRRLMLISITNASAVNNTRISFLFSLTSTAGSRSSAVYIQRQSIGGFDFTEGPRFGENVSLNYDVNVTNILKNYTLSGLKVVYFVPLNGSVINATNGSIIKSFVMTSLDQVNGSYFNGTTYSRINVTLAPKNINFTDNLKESVTNGNNVSIWFVEITIPLDDNRFPFNAWNPDSASSNASLKFMATVQFPVMEEKKNISLTAGSLNTYNATVNVAIQSALNLTGQTQGLNASVCGSDGSACNVTIKIDNSTLNSSQYIVGSLTLTNVESGTHTISVSYTLPSSSGSGGGTGGGTATGGGVGGGGGAVTPPSETRAAKLVISGPQLVEIMHGEEEDINILVRNTGNATANSIVLSVLGISSGWVDTFPRLPVNISEGEEQEFQIHISVPENATIDGTLEAIITAGNENVSISMTIILVTSRTERQQASLLLEEMEKLKDDANEFINILKEFGLDVTGPSDLAGRGTTDLIDARNNFEFGDYNASIMFSNAALDRFNKAISELNSIAMENYDRLVDSLQGRFLDIRPSLSQSVRESLQGKFQRSRTLFDAGRYKESYEILFDLRNILSPPLFGFFSPLFIAIVVLLLVISYEFYRREMKGKRRGRIRLIRDYIMGFERDWDELKKKWKGKGGGRRRK